ncbi:MAG: hypothetical protein EZS28_019235 [Streblomastix strix]|uniref:Uncharacterized protein n=1 Tax=Streblomastix strix TaxID=222440 RepID=A0A5J4VS44_9EUKA|nr:MAG: hypothetical protein EZS28_019235 [Streblomastix strix]
MLEAVIGSKTVNVTSENERQQYKKIRRVLMTQKGRKIGTFCQDQVDHKLEDLHISRNVISASDYLVRIHGTLIRTLQEDQVFF